MGRVQSLATMTEVRLRKWPAGRVSQLKLFLGHLQQAVGISLAAQVEQSPKRKFSEFVPKIVEQDITTEVSHREIRVFFETPRGLKNLLFYEFQLSATEGFYNFDQFQSPETQYLWPGLDEGRTYFLRIRVVTKDGEVGPWSDVLELETPYAQSYGLYDGTERTTRLSTRNSNPWVPVYERDYTAIGGKAYYAIDYSVKTARSWFANVAAGSNTGNVEWSDCEFRWMENVGSTGVEADFRQRGQQFCTTTYSSNIGFGATGFYLFSVGVAGYTTPLKDTGAQWENTRTGTFVQKFSTMTAGDYTLRLEGRIHLAASSNNFFYATDPRRTKIVRGRDALVSLRNFNIFEALITDS